MITPEQQRLVIEKLYRSSDSISSTEKFNEKYGSSTGEMGEKSMELTDFGRRMKKTDFLTYRVEEAVKDVTGKTIDLETL